jgi:PAS domain-containing protein
MAAGGYFAHEMAILRQRIAALEQRGPEPSPQQPSVIAEAAEALAVALEELRAANEELQQQNEDLAAANRRYQELFSLAPDAYLVTDVHGTIQEVNGAASHLLKIRTRVQLPETRLPRWAEGWGVCRPTVEHHWASDVGRP